MYIKISNITCNDFYIEYDESMRQFIQVGSALQCSSTNNGTYYICIIAIIYGNINSLFIFVNYDIPYKTKLIWTDIFGDLLKIWIWRDINLAKSLPQLI